MKKKSFKMNFMNQEMILSKLNVEFHHDLGIVSAYSLLDGDYNSLPLFGIVNKNFKEIIPLFPYQQLEKFSILDKENIILMVKENYASNLYHIIIKDGNISWYYLPYHDYRNINDYLLELVDFRQMHSLYDVRERKVITPSFHYISSFEYDDNYEDVVAQAIYILFYDEEHYNQIVTYINLKGEILMPYLDYDHDFYFDQSMSLEEVIAIVKENMRGNSR